MCSASGISTQTSASFAVARLRADSRSSQESGVHDDCPLCLPDAPEMLRTIISGGQTGADRAALDLANQAGLEQGGCPGNIGRIETRRMTCSNTCGSRAAFSDEKYENAILHRRSYG